MLGKRPAAGGRFGRALHTALGRTVQPRLPVACPVCHCERVEPDGRGTHCVCHSCGDVFSREDGLLAYALLSGSATGTPELEPGDLLELQENPEHRPYLWDLE